MTSPLQIMEILLDKIRALLQYQQLLKQIRANGKQISGLGLSRAARLPVLAALHQDLNRPILLITDRADHALSLFDELGFWVKSPRYHFSEPNPLFYEQAAWGVTTRRERLQTLTALAAYHLPFAQKPEEPPIFVTSARSLMTRTLPRRDFLKACKKLALGQTTQPDSILRHLVEIGYQRTNTVLEPGQFSRRGGILDVWTPQFSSHPLVNLFPGIWRMGNRMVKRILMLEYQTSKYPNFTFHCCISSLPAFWIICRKRH